MKLLVRNLSRSTTEAELKKLFASFGTVEECTLVLDKKTGKSKGFCFIEMPNDQQAKKAMRGIDDGILAGKRLRVRIAK